MKISVIIPTFNEAAYICETLSLVKNLPGDFEIIVVDGGSSDATVEDARQMGVKVLTSAKGRGQQMNLGARESKGDVLLFLHADTRLPINTYDAIYNALSDLEIAGGCFRFRFDHKHPILNFSSNLSRFKLRLIHYGDSCYFVHSDIFQQLNGYKQLPIMEDLDFWLRLNKNYKTVLLSEEVVTSARRFLQFGVIRQQSLAVFLVGLFVLGIKPSLLARIYFSRIFRRQKSTFHGKLPTSNITKTSSESYFPELHAFKAPTALDKLRYPIDWFWRCLYSNIHMTKQTFNVLDFIWLHKVRAGLLNDSHPWITGIIPGTEALIWDKNIIFASPRKDQWHGPEPKEDSLIIRQVGMFLAAMVRRSNATEPEIPQGKKRRMPHAVNYIHGTVHFNGGFLLFNDFIDAMYYFSDRKFVRELLKFAQKEKREHTIVFRQRDYDPEEYAWFLSFLRAHLLWYANANGPTKKRVLHGTPSPYPVVNPINGAWIRDIRNLQKGRLDKLVKPVISGSDYFKDTYCGNQSEYTFLERFHAWGQYLVTSAKGFQGGLVFTDRKKIEPENWITYQETNGNWRSSYAISHPFMSIESARAKRAI